MKETRSSILLTRLAKKIRKETGDKRYRARVEDERASLRTLIFISITRPIREFSFMFCVGWYSQTPVDLMLTEPIVASFSVTMNFPFHVSPSLTMQLALDWVLLGCSIRTGRVGLSAAFS